MRHRGWRSDAFRFGDDGQVEKTYRLASHSRCLAVRDVYLRYGACVFYGMGQCCMGELANGALFRVVRFRCWRSARVRRAAGIAREKGSPCCAYCLAGGFGCFDVAGRLAFWR